MDLKVMKRERVLRKVKRRLKKHLRQQKVTAALVRKNKKRGAENSSINC